MITLHVTQQFSVRERFTVTDDQGTVRYSVDGSFFRIPKEFRITDAAGNMVARLWKVPISLMPRYILEIGGEKAALIQQRFTMLRKRLTVTPIGSYSDIEVRGDIWNMNFDLFRRGRPVGHVGQKWLSLRDRFTIVVEEPSAEILVVSIVVAIDHIKRMEARSASAAAAG